MEVFNIMGWEDQYTGAEFKQDQVFPMESVFNLEELKNSQFDVLKTIFTNIFNVYRWSHKCKEEFIEEMRNKRKYKVKRKLEKK